MTIRVLHVDTGREWRGGQRQLFLLTRGLRDLEYEPLVVAPSGAPLAARLRERGLAASTTPMRGPWDLAAMRQIRKLLRTWNPDVVHAHDAHAHALLLGALEGDLATPLVVTRRTTARPTPRGLEVGHRVARYIAVSRHVRAALIAGGIDPVLIDVIAPGVEPTDAVTPCDWRRARGWPAGTIVCGVAGTLAAKDGFPSLARILELLPATARERTGLVIFGPGEVEEAKLGGTRVLHAEATSRSAENLAGLDVLWHSAQPHGLGIVVLDAMGLGVPVLAFATGPIAELVEHDVSGMLVAEGDVGAFAAAAARLIDDDRARRILAAGGPAQAARFDVQHMVDAHDRVYRSLTPASSSSSGER